MNYGYNYGYSSMDDEALMGILLVILGVMGVVLLVSLIFAILRSVGLYAIAKRRGIPHAWMSWIPIGSAWVLGAVADQYQNVAEGKVKSRRKIMLALNLVSLVIGFANGFISVMLEAMVYDDSALMISAALSLITVVASWGIGIAYLIFYHICNYDLYRSCDPKNAVVFLVMGIIFGVTEPFFYFFNRKKDLGMVRPEPVQPAPVVQAQIAAPEQTVQTEQTEQTDSWQ